MRGFGKTVYLQSAFKGKVIPQHNFYFEGESSPFMFFIFSLLVVCRQLFHLPCTLLANGATDQTNPRQMFAVTVCASMQPVLF